MNVVLVNITHRKFLMLRPHLWQDILSTYVKVVDGDQTSHSCDTKRVAHGDRCQNLGSVSAGMCLEAYCLNIDMMFGSISRRDQLCTLPQSLLQILLSTKAWVGSVGGCPDALPQTNNYKLSGTLLNLVFHYSSCCILRVLHQHPMRLHIWFENLCIFVHAKFYRISFSNNWLSNWWSYYTVHNRLAGGLGYDTTNLIQWGGRWPHYPWQGCCRWPKIAIFGLYKAKIGSKPPITGGGQACN